MSRLPLLVRAMTSDQGLGSLLARLQVWEDAHVGFDRAVADVPRELRGTLPAGLPYSIWSLVEHIRLAQHDILDFCRNPDYRERDWPAGYWPASAAPPSDAAWTASLRQVHDDRAALQRLATDPSVDLEARILHGQGQTYMRELALAADHAAYHVGQIVLVRRLLGLWPER